MNRSLDMSIQNESKTTRRIGSMLNKTRALLHAFFAPFNKRMADFMNDERYLFKHDVLSPLQLELGNVSVTKTISQTVVGEHDGLSNE